MPEDFYDAICAAFGFDAAADTEAARLLARVMPSPVLPWRELGMALRNRDVAILGAGPSLDRVTRAEVGDARVLCADGATTWCRHVGIIPDVVVTDLDGDPTALAWAAQAGSQMVIHAHGDNMQALRDVAPRLAPRWHGTYQGADPGIPLFRNLHGFTDGDRAVLLAETVGARRAVLFGFDWDGPAGPYSGHLDTERKRRKLVWAKRIVDAVHVRGRLPLTQYVPRGAPSR